MSNALITAEEPVLRGLLQRLPPGLAVDVGAGTGRIAGILAGLGHRVIAIDPSSAMIARVAANAPGARRVGAEVARIPLRDAAVDLVTCALTLTHVADLTSAIGELARIVRPGGSVVTSDIHPLAVATGAHAFPEDPEGQGFVVANEVHWQSEYIAAAGRAGMRVDRCEEVFVDEALLRASGVEDVWIDPMSAVVGLPFALIWVFRRA